MSIEDVFSPGKDCPYVVDNIVPGIPRKVAREVVIDFLEQNPQGVVWAFYQRLKMPIKESIILNGKQFDQCCYLRDLALISRTVPAHKLFPDVRAIYVQLCMGQPPQGIGFVERRLGPEVFTTEIGHYRF